MVVIRCVLGLLSLFALVLPTAAWGLVQQPKVASTSEVIAKLASEERNLRIAGFNSFVRIPREERTADLNAALVESLEKEVAMRHAIATGIIPPKPWDASHEFVVLLLDEVEALRDPATIPLLMQLIRMGSSVCRSLVAFGRTALPHLVARISEEQPAMEKTIAVVLLSLRFFIEAWGLDYLTDEERAEFRRLAVQFMDLKPGEYPTNAEYTISRESDPVWRPTRLAYATQLAWALEEPDLRDHVIAIGSDLEALRLRGIVDEKAMRRFHQTYQPLVAGEPAMPSFAPR